MRAEYSADEIGWLKRNAVLSDIIRSSVVWDKGRSRPQRGEYWACCPFHQERTPSFRVDNRRGKFRCFGCGATGDVIDWLREHERLSFREAVERISGRPKADKPKPVPASSGTEKRDITSGIVRRIWREARPIAGTKAEQYLVGRGLVPCEWPRCLRFHASLEWALGRVVREEAGATILVSKGPFLPALVAAVQQPDGIARGVWRIFLDPDGNGKAKVTPNKLGKGAARTGAVRIGGMARIVGVAEGVETALAVWQLGEMGMPCWATLSTSGMQAFIPPEGVDEVRIFMDPDVLKFNGRQYKAAGPDAAAKLKARLDVEGRVKCTLEPTPLPGRDWLDVLWDLRRIDG